MNWQAGILGAFGAMFFVCMAVWVAHEVRKGPKLTNRRTGLPAPRADERSSIEQFKRMHNV